MKFRDPKTGEVLENICVVYERFCCKNERCSKECPLAFAKSCSEFVWEHQRDAARLMGYEVIEDEKEDNMEKKKLFISQPMRGKTDEEIQVERSAAIKAVKAYTGEDFEVLDTFFRDFDGTALQFIAKSIEKLAEADVAYFAPGWEKARGCRIEHECAKEYGIEIFEPVEVSKPAKPRLAEVLGVDVGELIRISGGCFNTLEFCIEQNGFPNFNVCDALVYAINHPESIIRAPRLTETERIFLQGIPGVKWVSRDVNADDGYVDLWGAKPELIEGCYNGPQGIGVIGRISSGLCISVHPGDCIEV